MARQYKRDARGRFASGGGLMAAAGRRARLRKNQERTAKRVSEMAGIAGGSLGRNEGVRKMARKLTNSARVNARAERTYRARARG